jgi:glyoxylase-like metal-dependent hydrolase (beta-lactamase superfamily II)
MAIMSSAPTSSTPFLKQYEKFSTFLRNELCSNNLTDFGLRKGLDHLDAVRQTFQSITSRFAGYQAQWLNVHVDFPLLQRIALPITIGSVRYPGIAYIVLAWKIPTNRLLVLTDAQLAWGLRARSKGRNNMRVCIHRGTKQIGGTCVEIEASGTRIVVDLGLPLDAVEADVALVPQISGLKDHDPSLLAIVLSHGHRDHWGLIPKVRPDIPIVVGRATERIMRAAADFVPDAWAPKAWKYLESGKLLQIGPFSITPHLVDHSGFDAYALEIEADGRRLFYTGDLRAHGRKGKLFERMLKNSPKDIDVMLIHKRRLVQAAQGTQNWVPRSERQNAAEAVTDTKALGRLGRGSRTDHSSCRSFRRL